MKTLELNQMEELQGGWSWGSCTAAAAGAGMASIESGLAVLTGGWGLLGAVVVGCAVGGFVEV